MNEKIRYIVIILSLLLIIVLVIFKRERITYTMQRNQVPGTPEEVDKFIKLRLSSGDHVSKVQAFLDTYKITHSKILIQRNDVYDSDLNNEKFKGRAHLVRSKIFATIPSNRISKFLYDINIQVLFYFDENENVVDYLVREVEDGP